MIAVSKSTQSPQKTKLVQERPVRPESTARPSVPPVIALCGHIGRSERHTCGSATCIRLYSW